VKRSSRGESGSILSTPSRSSTNHGWRERARRPCHPRNWRSATANEASPEPAGNVNPEGAVRSSPTPHAPPSSCVHSARSARSSSAGSFTKAVSRCLL